MWSKLRLLAAHGAQETSEAHRKAAGWPLWLWLALAGAVLALHGAAYAYALVNQSFWQDDTTQYLTQALRLTAHNTISQSYLAPILPDVQRTPGYGVFLWLLGSMPWLVLLVQHGLVLLTGWFIYLIINILYQNKMAALLGGFAWALMPFAANFASFMLTESLFSALILGGLWLFALALRGAVNPALPSFPRRGWRRFDFALVLACVIWALGCYVKGLAFMVMPIAGVVWLWRFRRQPKAWLPLGLGALLAVAIVAPWLFRNHAITHRWTFGTLGQTALIYGRLGGVLAMERDLPMDDATLFHLSDSLLTQAFGVAHFRYYPHGKATQETALFTADAEAFANDFMREHWQTTLRFQVFSFGLMLRGVGRQTAWVISYNEPYTWFCTVWEAILMLLIYMGLAGSVWRIRRLSGPEVVALLSATAFILLHAAAWADGRYRLVADPLFVLLAAPVWVRWLSKSKRLSGFRSSFTLTPQPPLPQAGEGER